MATTTNFGWETPDDTDLVKDGAAAIRTALGGVDTSFVDLKGGTTGQVLAKATNTDLDFSWVAQDDSNAIQNAIVDAKGDLIAATAADTPARLAVGTNGQVLTADSTAGTGLAWTTIASGAYTQIATGTLSGASVTISSIASTYKDLVVVLAGITQSTSSTAYIQLNNGANIGSSNIYSSSLGNGTTGSYLWIGASSSYNMNNTAAENSFTYVISNYAAATRKAVFGFGGYRYTADADVRGFITYGDCSATSAINEIDIVTSSGTFSGGTYIVYGVK